MSQLSDPAVFIGFSGFFVIGLAFGFVAGARFEQTRDKKLVGPHVSIHAFCPACGHQGCKLKYIPPGSILVGDKQKAEITEAMVARVCNTCDAVAYEKTVLPAEQWIAK